MGHTYTLTCVPSPLFDKVVSIAMGTEKKEEGAFGPRAFIRKRADELVAEFQSLNPKAKITGQIRLQAEVTAQTDYLQLLYSRGKL